MAVPHPLPRVIALPVTPQHGQSWWRRQQVVRRDEMVSVALGALVGAVLGGCGWLLWPATYSAQATLQLDAGQPVSVKESALPGAPRDPAALRTELDVLTSRPLLRAALAAGQAQDELAVAQLGRQLSVQLVPGSDTLLVRVSGPVAQRAAAEANALVAAYLSRQQAAQLEATQAAGRWLDGRLQAMQLNVATAELAVAKFKAGHQLTAAASGLTLGDQQLSDLNSQLLLARAQEAEAGARVSAAAAHGAGTSRAVLDSPLIQQLHEQEALARRNVALLGARYGARHPDLIAARQELAALEGKINEETLKERASLGTDVATAHARAAALAAQLGALQAGAGKTSADAVQLAELERQAQASRVLYESFLGRSKELAQPGFYQPPARVIAWAEAPAESSGPAVWLVLALAAVVGGLAGLALRRGSVVAV